MGGAGVGANGDGRRPAPVDVLVPGVAVAALVAVAAYSLVALAAADDSLGMRTERFGLADGMPWRLRLGSLVVASAVYLLADGGRSWRRPAPGPGRDVVGVVVLWLAGVAVGTTVTGRGGEAWDGAVSAAQDVLVEPLIEELVFRGALFALATKVAADRWQGAITWRFPIVLTAVLFWLGHWQGEWYDTPTWIDGRGYTILNGFVYGWLRDRTGSLWAPIALHVVGNAIALLGVSL